MRPNDTLRAAHDARAAARVKHAANSEALARGRERLAAAQTEIERLAGEDAEAIARHAQRLEAQARAGNTGPVPQLVPSDHLAAEISARRTHQASVQMIASLEEAERGSGQALKAAEAAVERAADAVLDAEALVHARGIEELLAEVQRRAVVLRTYVPDGLRERAAALSCLREISRVLERVPSEVNDLNTPVNVLRYGQPSSSRLTEMRRALIASEAGGDPAGDPSAQAAA